MVSNNCAVPLRDWIIQSVSNCKFSVILHGIFIVVIWVQEVKGKETKTNAFPYEVTNIARVENTFI